jgi:hypothetical protein
MSLIPLIPIEIKNLPNSAGNFSEIATLISVGKNENYEFGRPWVFSSSGPLALGAAFGISLVCEPAGLLTRRPNSFRWTDVQTTLFYARIWSAIYRLNQWK